MMNWHRIFEDKRRLLVPLAVLAGANLVLYAVAVYPLSIKVAGADARARNVARQAEGARAEFEAARETLESKVRARAELDRFYREVLPPDLAGARRATYVRMAQLADEFSLRYNRRSSVPEQVRDSELVRLVTTMRLAGDYRNFRRLIYRLETAPEFIVIDDVRLDQGDELGLTLRVSTHYWAGADGT